MKYFYKYTQEEILIFARRARSVHEGGRRVDRKGKYLNTKCTTMSIYQFFPGIKSMRKDVNNKIGFKLT